MNAKQPLLEAALSHFAQDGYEGASLQKIAEDAGIKKPSIYAHYKGKEELFLQTLKKALREEGHRITRYFASMKDQPAQHRLRSMLEYMLLEYTRSSKTKFVLRIAYFPPSSLYDEVMDMIYPFLESMEKRMIRFMKDQAESGSFAVVNPEHAAIAFMTLTDGILIDMVCAGLGSAQRRLSASWPIYWAGIHYEDPPKDIKGGNQLQ